MATSIVDISQINIKELIRDIGEKEAMRLLKQVLENNVLLLNLQNKYWNYKQQKIRKGEGSKIENKEEESMMNSRKKKNRERK